MKPDCEERVRRMIAEELRALASVWRETMQAAPPEAAPVTCHCGRWVWRADLCKWECTNTLTKIGAIEQGARVVYPAKCRVCGDHCERDGTVTPNPARTSGTNVKL